MVFGEEFKIINEGTLKEHCTQKKRMNSLNVEYFLAMNIQYLDKNG